MRKLGKRWSLRHLAATVRLGSVLVFTIVCTSFGQPAEKSVTDLVTPQFKGLCKSYSSRLGDNFSSALPDIYKAASEKSLIPIGEPFAMLMTGVVDESAILDSTTWKMCLNVPSDTAVSTGQDYNIDSFESARLLSTICSQAEDTTDNCRQGILAYASANHLLFVSSYLINTATPGIKVLSIFVTGSEPAQEDSVQH